MGIAAAIVGAAALSAGAGIYASSQQASAQRSAAAQARKSQQEANDINYQEFLKSRGSEGSALLPMYLKENGALFEPELGSDLISAYRKSTPNFDNIFGATSRFNQGVLGASGLTNNLFNGGVTNTMLNNLAPVAKARVAYSRQSALDALNKTLQEISATQASKGYVGDSLGNRLLRFNANLTGQNQIAQANLANLEDIKAIRDQYGTLLPLQNIGLPFQIQQQAGYSSVLPQAIYTNSILNSLQPLSFIKIGTGNPPTAQPLPVAGPIPGTGQLVAQGLGQVAGAGMNYGLSYLQSQQLQAQQKAMMDDYFTHLQGMNSGYNSDLGYLSGLGASGYGAGGAGAGTGAYLDASTFGDTGTAMAAEGLA